jgi:two-component system response regulator VicR
MVNWMAKKVMIVDDERDLCETIELLLEGKGFEVVTALSGAEALLKLEKERPDLVLIDYFMPEMSGVGLANRIRADPKLKDLKLAFLTVAEFSAKGKEELSKLKILDHIRKPFDNEDLVRRVKRMVKE